MLKQFGFDFNKFTPLPGFRTEIWQYNYIGQGKRVLTLSKENEKGEVVMDYNYDFQIDPKENFIVLVSGHLGATNHALIVERIISNGDIFSFPVSSFSGQYTNLIGDFALLGWTKDSRYFWARTHTGAKTLAFLRIDSQTWNVDILPAPNLTQGGDALNVEKGWITYNNGPGWIGVDTFSTQIAKEWREQGKKVTFSLYNLFTKESIPLVTVDDPVWWIKPKWISDTELQYELPNGEKKVYTIQK